MGKIKEIFFNIKKNLLKTYLSCKGWFLTKTFFVEGNTYSGGPNKALSIYRGNRVFYEQQQVSTMGVLAYSTKNVTYPYWQLAFFKWLKISTKIVNE